VTALRAAETPRPDLASGLARKILKETGIKGGLIVHLGCGDGKLTAAFGAGHSYLVQGLDAGPENVAKAREYIRQRGIYGKVSVRDWSGDRLPHGDNVVNLVVASGEWQVAKEEIRRVLTPGGVAISLKPTAFGLQPFRKPWPEETDEWTHWLHDASGNAVARDRVVGQPRHIQWAARPKWSRHHNTTPSLNAAVSAGGRFFYIADEAPAEVDNSLPDRYSLFARDAFNGVLLWKIPIDYWGWEAWVQTMYNNFMLGRHMHPTQIQRRLVAVGDRVYVTLGFNAPVSELDAASGQIVRDFAGTKNTSEILWYDGRLVLAVNKEPQRAGYIEEDPPTKKEVKVLDLDSGEILWSVGDFVGISVRGSPVQRVTQLTMAVGKEGVFLVEEDCLVGLDLSTGKELWRVPRPPRPAEKVTDAYRNDHTNLCTLVYYDGKVIFGQPREQGKKPPWNNTQPSDLLVLDAASGDVNWTKEIGSWEYGTPIGIYVTGGLIWVHDRPEEGYQVVGLDPKSGEVKKRMATEAMFNAGHHHRCTRNKATERFLITSRRGVEMVNFDSGDIEVNTWIRGECGYGIVPCNGLLYVTPHPCRCFIEEKLSGLYALAPEGKSKSRKVETSKSEIETRLEKGPGYSEVRDQKSEVRDQESEGGVASRASRQGVGNLTSDLRPLTSSVGWPTYRGDPYRSGATGRTPAELKQAWQADIGVSPSAPVIADGKVFVASVEEHRVCALDAASGRQQWAFTAGGRVDTPPTIHRGTVLFGSRDGHVYCLRASDGELCWRLRAAPHERLVVAYSQVESAWPVHGSILVVDDVAYFAAGRSSHLDGGIYVFAVDPATGEVLREEAVVAEERLSQKEGGAGGALSDILVFDGSAVRMRQMQFGLVDRGEPTAKRDKAARMHVFAAGGLLDDTWFNRIYWAVDRRPLGQLVVADDVSVYGIRAYQRPGDVNAHFKPGTAGYLLFAHDRRQPKVDGAAKQGSQKKPRRGKRPLIDRWSVRIPVRAQAMVLAGDVLFAAGTPDVVDPKEPWAAYDGRRGGVMWAVSAEYGSRLAEYRLDAPPVFDGMAAANRRLFVSTVDGKLTCYSDQP